MYLMLMNLFEWETNVCQKESGQIWKTASKQEM